VDVDVREHGGSRVTLHVRLDETEVQSAFDRTYQRLSDYGGIKGFRPGKVPRKILERHYDPEAVRALIYEELVTERVEEAMSQQELRPIEQVHIEAGPPPDEEELLAETIKSGLVRDEEDEAEEIAEEPEVAAETEGDDEPPEIPLVEGEAFEFYTTVTVYPRPTLPDLTQLKLRRPVAEVTDEEVEERIEQLRRVQMEEVDVDREQIEQGDVVIADVKVVLEGEDADEIEPNEEEIIVGEHEYLEDIDQALVGHGVGDIVDAEFQYAEDHPDEELAGRSARIIAEVRSFSGRQLPELDDDFAREQGNYESVEELRAGIREQLEEAREAEAREELEAQLLRHLLQETKIDFPEEFLEEAAEHTFDALRDDLQRMGMSVQEFAEATDRDEQELRESQRARAEVGLTLHFALDALARERGIEVTDEDVQEELQRIAAESGGDMEFVQQAAAIQPDFAEEVQDRARRRKLIADVLASVEIEDVPIEEYEADRAEEPAEAEEPGPTDEGEPADEVEETEQARQAESPEASNLDSRDGAEGDDQESEPR